MKHTVKKPVRRRVATDTRIAGVKTVRDWRRFKRKLKVGGSVEAWQVAFRDYFYERLSTRYLAPIAAIRARDTEKGEGFSIVAIHCTLVEYFESTIQGISYHYLLKGESLGPYEYRDSMKKFVDFLCNRRPFNKVFDAASALDFYLSVRCGLLHEARTKNGWTISVNRSRQAISIKKKVIYRNNFHDALLEFVDWYEQALMSTDSLQEAFIRKFDSLCVG